MNLKNSMRKALHESLPAGRYGAHSNNKRARLHRYAKHCGQGFMMIEAVFSIFIVGTILVSFMAVMGSVFRTEFAKRDLIVATNLAQEGIEIVRNVRDNNWKATPPKAAFDGSTFPANAIGGTNYLVAYGHNSINPWSNTNLKLLGNGFYDYAASGGTITKFSRTIRISGSGDSRTIDSTVNWNSQSVTMTDTLYAWGDPD